MSSRPYTCMTAQIRGSLFCCSGRKTCLCSQTLIVLFLAINVNGLLNPFTFLLVANRRAYAISFAPPRVTKHASELLIMRCCKSGRETNTCASEEFKLHPPPSAMEAQQQRVQKNMMYEEINRLWVNCVLRWGCLSDSVFSVFANPECIRNNKKIFDWDT